MSGRFTLPFSAFQALPPITPALLIGETRTIEQRLHAAHNDAQESLEQCRSTYEAAYLSLQTAQAQYRKAAKNANDRAWRLETAVRWNPLPTPGQPVPAGIPALIKSTTNAHVHADKLKKRAFVALQDAEEEEREAKSALASARIADADAARTLEIYVDTGIDLSPEGLGKCAL